MPKSETGFVGCIPMLICNLQVGFILLKAAGFLEAWTWWQVFAPCLVLTFVLAVFLIACTVGAALGSVEKHQ